LKIPTQADNGAAFVAKNLPQAQSSIRLRFWFRYEDRAAGTTDFAQLRFDNYYVQLLLQGDDYMVVQERRPPVDGGDPSVSKAQLDRPLEAKRWYHFDLLVERTAMRASVTIDGTPAGEHTLPQGFSFDSTDVRLIIGEIYIDAVVGTWDLRYDDVVVEVK
jgi:hypothetical protein